MENQFHILNGDSLKMQFPKQIYGEILVARECLVDGNVSGATLDELFSNRADFITELDGGYSKEDYFSNSVSEFKRIQKIPDKSEIYLWFEDDLFCQVNFWFTVYLISKSVSACNVFLIRPVMHTQYGFGGLSEFELIELFKHKTPIVELDRISSLWICYQNNKIKELAKVAKDLESAYPFINKAVEAHIDRIPNESYPGRPIQTLIDIMNELGTDSFGPVFTEFSKREAIYGYGDLQVKRILDEIKNKRK